MDDLTSAFNTPMDGDLGPATSSFAEKYGESSKYDYDMQGFHMANPDANMAEGQHFPDTFKKPNHPTFSDQSIYHGQGGIRGGSWDLLDDGSFSFTPGRTNLEQHTTQDLIDYFKKNEPKNHLILPGS